MAVTLDQATSNVHFQGTSSSAMREAKGQGASPALITVVDGFERADKGLVAAHEAINDGAAVLANADRAVEPQLARGLVATVLGLFGLTKFVPHTAIAATRIANNGAEAAAKTGIALGEAGSKTAGAIADGASYIVRDGNPAQVR